MRRRYTVAPLRNRSIVYVTADGVLEPIGYSQIVRVVERLAERGFRYSIVSLEKPEALARSERVEALRRQLAARGIKWVSAPYRQGGSKSAATRNMAVLWAIAARELSKEEAGFVHARAYHGATVALGLKRLFGVPYLFDARSYWIDERLEEGRWFTRPAVLGGARRLERALYKEAGGLVTLTRLQLLDVQSGRFGPWRARPADVIPTCADFEEFRPRAPDELAKVPPAMRRKLAGKLVVGLVGSINRSYLIDRTIALAKRLVELRGDAHLLVLTGQVDHYKQLLVEARIRPERYDVLSVPHEQMPEWQALIHWGVQLLAETPSKRASMPTKLAEFLATGVRPVHIGCNSEVSEWVRRVGSGIVLTSVEATALDAAARMIAETQLDPEVTRRARELAHGHFSLATGVERYTRVLEAMIAQGEESRRLRWIRSLRQVARVGSGRSTG